MAGVAVGVEGGRGGSVRVLGYRGEAAATLRCPFASIAPYLHSRRLRRAWSARRAAWPPLDYPSAPRLPAGTQPFASLLHAPRRWQEVNIEFGIGEFNVENHPRRVLRNFERERGQDGWQV